MRIEVINYFLFRLIVALHFGLLSDNDSIIFIPLKVVKPIINAWPPTHIVWPLQVYQRLYRLAF